MRKRLFSFQFALAILAMTSSLSVFGQSFDSSNINSKLRKHLLEAVKGYEGSVNTVVFDPNNFKLSKELNDFKVSYSVDGLQNYVEVNVFYSTSQIRYTLFENKRELRSITKTY